jgi:DNA-binding NarL/FixJ family response regulator
MRILLVDDHREVRSVLRVALSMRARLRVVGEATSLAEAVEIAGQLHPDTIVLDLVLPDVGHMADAALAALQQAAPMAEIVVYTGRESVRGLYEREGVPFFGKVSDSLNDLVDFLAANAA